MNTTFCQSGRCHSPNTTSSPFPHLERTIFDAFGLTFAVLAVFFNAFLGLLIYKQRLYRKKSSWSTLVLITSECFVSLVLIIILPLRLHSKEFGETDIGGRLIIFIVTLDTIPTGVLLFTAHDRYIRLKDLINYSSNFNVRKFWFHYVCSFLLSIALGAFLQILPHFIALVPWFLIVYFLCISVSGCIFSYKSYKITQSHVHEYSTLLLTKLRKLMRIHVQQMLFLFGCYGLRVVVLGLSVTKILPYLASSVLFNTSIVLNPFLSLLNALTLIYMDPFVRNLIQSSICQKGQIADIAHNKNNAQNIAKQAEQPGAVFYICNNRNIKDNQIQFIPKRPVSKRVIRFWSEDGVFSFHTELNAKDLTSQEVAVTNKQKGTQSKTIPESTIAWN